MLPLALMAILGSSEKARSVAKDLAVEAGVEYGAAKLMGPKLGPPVINLVIGMCSDQAGSCETQATERMINRRIAKEFPWAYSPPDYCLIGIGWPCIEVFTGNEKGPGYEEARARVIQMLNDEAQKEQIEKMERVRGIQERFKKNFDLGKDAFGGRCRRNCL
jgi:hypothetical protein